MSASYPSSTGWEPYGSSQQAAAVGWRTSATQPSQIPTPSPPLTQPTISRPPVLPHWKRSTTTSHIPPPVIEPSRGEQRLLAGQRTLNETIEKIAEHVSVLSKTVEDNKKIIEHLVESSQRDMKLVSEKVDGLQNKVTLIERKRHNGVVKLLVPKIREATTDIVRQAADKAVKALGDLWEKKMEEAENEDENENNCRNNRVGVRRRNLRVFQKDTVQSSRILRSQTAGRQPGRKEKVKSEYTELSSSQTDDSSDDDDYVATKERKRSRQVKKRKTAQKKTKLAHSSERFSLETDSDYDDEIQAIVEEQRFRGRKRGRRNEDNEQKITNKGSKRNVPHNTRVLRSRSIPKHLGESNKQYPEGSSTQSSQTTKTHRGNDYNINAKTRNRIRHKPSDQGNTPKRNLRPRKQVTCPEIIVLEESESTQLDFEEQALQNSKTHEQEELNTGLEHCLSVVADDENASDPFFFQDNQVKVSPSEIDHSPLRKCKDMSEKMDRLELTINTPTEEEGEDVSNGIAPRPKRKRCR